MKFSKAVHRFYESRRRLFNDEQPNRKCKAEEVKKKCRKVVQQKKVKVHIRNNCVGHVFVFSFEYCYTCDSAVAIQ